ncbi:ATP-binding cassette domain-containing protein [Flavobacterium sp.]|uniref:ATP-binding cassette domain-containing protein n=1 Tax=Flavobacterium sp. TaxID=239 RepID=UPI002601B20F|nr:ATP-binding cassette domain-containing protein [Flavobacterium sp.]
MHNTLSAKHIKKSFKGKTIFENVNLECETGQITGVFGRNGSGKSTLLKILFGILKADTVHVTINQQYIAVKDIIPQQLIAYLPQHPFIPKYLKVRDIIPMYYQGDEQDKLFYAQNIHKITNTKAGNLSMGELRYFELLLISNLNHPFLLLDEPFSMIEPLYKEHIKEYLLKLKDKKGIVITDHYYRDVLEVSNNNLLLDSGFMKKIIAEQELIEGGYLPKQ